MKAPVALGLVALLLSGGCSRNETAAPRDPYRSVVRFEGERVSLLHVALARTETEKRRGLMNVSSLPHDAGMAFVWTEPTDSAFWMKDTLVPLSVAFVDGDGRIVTIRDMEPCRSDPCRTYRSNAPFVLAIETNAGWFDRNDVAVGDRAVLEGA
jgi:hypothetical protein